MAEDQIIGLQDVIRCHLCEEPVPPLHCELCHINLCRPCAGTHLLDESKEHIVLPYNKEWYANSAYPLCADHSTQCQVYCKQCDILICTLCSKSEEHKTHPKLHIFEHLLSTTKTLKEVEESTNSKFQEIPSSFGMMNTRIEKNQECLEHIEDRVREMDCRMQKDNQKILKRLENKTSDSKNRRTKKSMFCCCFITDSKSSRKIRDVSIVNSPLPKPNTSVPRQLEPIAYIPKR